MSQLADHEPQQGAATTGQIYPHTVGTMVLSGLLRTASQAARDAGFAPWCQKCEGTRGALLVGVVRDSRDGTHRSAVGAVPTGRPPEGSVASLDLRATSSQSQREDPVAQAFDVRHEATASTPAIPVGASTYRPPKLK